MNSLYCDTGDIEIKVCLECTEALSVLVSSCLSAFRTGASYQTVSHKEFRKSLIVVIHVLWKLG